jgi:hypothetical protein
MRADESRGALSKIKHPTMAKALRRRGTRPNKVEKPIPAMAITHSGVAMEWINCSTAKFALPKTFWDGSAINICGHFPALHLTPRCTSGLASGPMSARLKISPIHKIVGCRRGLAAECAADNKFDYCTVLTEDALAQQTSSNPKSGK